MPFPADCGVESVVVNLPDATGPLDLTVSHLVVWPQGVPVPDMATAPALLFDAVLRDASGAEVQPSSAVMQVRVPGSWLDACLGGDCQPTLFHFHAGAWTFHEMAPVDAENDTVVMQAEITGFSYFAVSGLDAVAPPQGGTSWIWPAALFAILAGTVFMMLRGGGLLKHINRDPEPEASTSGSGSVDARVSLLLKEMRNKEELLQFMNNAAHDLANPLTPIQLQLDLLNDAAQERSDPQQAQALTVVRQNVDQLGMLIADLRDAAKLQSGKLRFTLEDVDLTRLVKDAATAYLPQARDANVELTVNGNVHVPVRVDPGRITQVVTNFLNNALKFTPAEGSIDVSVSSDGTDVFVSVSDTGIGLTGSDQAKLFQPFSQGHGSREQSQGTGLGLYIAKQIIDAHRGRIGCASDGEGRGTTFWFTVPREPSAADAGKP